MVLVNFQMASILQYMYRFKVSKKAPKNKFCYYNFKCFLVCIL